MSQCRVYSDPVYILMLSCRITQNGNDLVATEGFDSYQWYSNGKAITGATSNTLSITEDGDYHVVVEDAGNCTGKSETIHAVYDKSEGPDGEPSSTAKRVNTYPNPGNGKFTLDAQLALEDKSADIIIMDATGHTLFTKQVEVKGGVLHEEIDITQSADHLFMVKVRSNGYNKTTKFIKQ